MRYFSPTAVNVTPLLLRENSFFPRKCSEASYLMADRRGGNIEILCGQLRLPVAATSIKAWILRKEGIGRFLLGSGWLMAASLRGARIKENSEQRGAAGMYSIGKSEKQR